MQTLHLTVLRLLSRNEIKFQMLLYPGTITSPKVECYCPQKRTWHALNDMNVGRSAASACAVTDIYNARDYSFHGNEELTSSEENLTRPTSVEENTKYAKTLARWRCASKH